MASTMRAKGLIGRDIGPRVAISKKAREKRMEATSLIIQNPLLPTRDIVAKIGRSEEYIRRVKRHLNDAGFYVPQIVGRKKKAIPYSAIQSKWISDNYRLVMSAIRDAGRLHTFNTQKREAFQDYVLNKLPLVMNAYRVDKGRQLKSYIYDRIIRSLAPDFIRETLAFEMKISEGDSRKLLGLLSDLGRGIDMETSAMARGITSKKAVLLLDLYRKYSSSKSAVEYDNRSMGQVIEDNEEHNEPKVA
ncbi:MAG TPA: hypothetical protein VJG83_07000 [archaeon]|nr:hypothetical protein [archaeon]